MKSNGPIESSSRQVARDEVDRSLKHYATKADVERAKNQILLAVILVGGGIIGSLIVMISRLWN